jgi:hypothetical protein
MDLLYFAYFAVNAVTCWYMLWHIVTCCDWKWLEIIGMIGLGMIGLTEWITIYITMNTKYIKIYNIIQYYTMIYNEYNEYNDNNRIDIIDREVNHS